MSGNRDRQEAPPDRGPPPAVDIPPPHPMYGINIPADQPASSDSMAELGIEGRRAYDTSGATRPWTGGREAEHDDESTIITPSVQPTPQPYYDHSRPYHPPSAPILSRHIPNYPPNPHLEGRVPPTSFDIPPAPYYGESSTSHHSPDMQLRAATERAPFDYPASYDPMPPPPIDQNATSPTAHSRHHSHPFGPYYPPPQRQPHAHQHPHQQQPMSPIERYSAYPSGYLDQPPSAYAQHASHSQSHTHTMTSPNQHHYQQQLPFVRDPYPNPGQSSTFAFSDPQAYHPHAANQHDGRMAQKERSSSLDSSLAHQKKPVTASRLGLDPVAKQERRREQNRMAQRAFRARAKVREQERSGSMDDDGENESSYPNERAAND